MNNSLRVIIAGSRSATREDVEDALAQCPWTPEIGVVLSGTAHGADQFGEAWAERHGIPIERFPADWNAHGKAAGPIRNRQMARQADGLVVAWDGVSRGTANMVQEAKARQLRVFIHRFNMVKP